MIVAIFLLACDAEPSESPLPQTPHASLDAMDKRQPVPLLPMMALHQKQQMQDHLVVVQEIVAGLAGEDWAAVSAAAERMGTSPQMAMTCEHMGAGADGFTEQALDFHRRADAISTAAAEKDSVAVLRATADTLQACTSCHETWRQQVVSPASWEAQTGASANH